MVSHMVDRFLHRTPVDVEHAYLWVHRAYRGMLVMLAVALMAMAGSVFLVFSSSSEQMTVLLLQGFMGPLLAGALLGAYTQHIRMLDARQWYHRLKTVD